MIKMNTYFIEFRLADLKHQRCSVIVSEDTKEEIEKKIRDEYKEKVTFLSVNLISGNCPEKKANEEKQMTLQGDF